MKNDAIKYLLTGALFITLIFVLPVKTSTVTLWSTLLVYGIAAMGYTVLLGYGGQISLGHAAFVGLGAYISAYVTQNLGLPFLVGVLAAAVLPMLMGLLLGAVALRLEGHYLAIATLGFGVAVQQVFKVVTGFTNGFAGKTAPSASILGLLLKGKLYFVFLVIMAVGLAIVINNILKARTGRALVAMRDSEHAAKAMGIDVVKYKLIAFVLSASYAGIAGALYMHLVKYTQPDVWGMTLSINLLAMVVIGGLGSIMGSFIGAGFIVLMPQFVHDIPYINEIPSASIIFTGIIIVLIIRYLPLGLAQGVDKLLQKVKGVYHARG